MSFPAWPAEMSRPISDKKLHSAVFLGSSTLGFYTQCSLYSILNIFVFLKCIGFQRYKTKKNLFILITARLKLFVMVNF